MPKKKDPRLARAGVSGYNKPKRTPKHKTKSHVVVAKEGNQIKTIRFGQQGKTGDKKNTARSRSFKARHAKNIKKGKMSAAYWANKEKWQMGSGKATPVEKWVEYLILRRSNSIYAAAKQANVNYHSARDNENGRVSTRNYVIAKEQVDKIGVSDIPTYDQLPAEVQECWNNIEKFALRYFGIILQPWQIEATEKVFELFETPLEEYVVINAPPGSGKSTFFAKVLPAWATVRNRAIRGMLGSSTQRLAEWYTRRLRAEFEREHVARAELNDVKLGIGIDAERTMQEDFGQFKPDAKEIWRAEAFTVVQQGDVPLSQKEPTWSAFGMDSGFLGGRFDLIIWDDVWDPRKMRNSESRSDMYRWWDEVAETRLEPGGLLILQGQRMAYDVI